MMKKYVVKIVVLVAVIVFAACSTLTPAQKAERRAKVEQAVNQALEEREYKIDIDLTPREREPISFSGKLDLVHTQ